MTSHVPEISVDHDSNVGSRTRASIEIIPPDQADERYGKIPAADLEDLGISDESISAAVVIKRQAHDVAPSITKKEAKKKKRRRAKRRAKARQ